MKKKLSLKRVLILMLTVVMVLTTLMFAGCNLIPGNKQDSTGSTLPPSGGGSTGGDSSSSPIYQMAKTMSFSSASTIAELPEGVTIQATVEPSNAYDKTVDWTCYWSNPSSSWATGKSVTSYLTVTPTSDGALTANVKCLQAFGEPIIIKVTSRANTSKTATCTVNFFNRVSDTISIDFEYGGLIAYETKELSATSSLSSASVIDVVYGYDSVLGCFLDEPTVTFGVGTLSSEATIVPSLEMSNGLKTQLQNQGLTVTPTDYTEPGILGNPPEFFGLKGLSLMGKDPTFEDIFGIDSDHANWTKLTSAISANTDNYDVAIKLTITTQYETTYRYLKIAFNEASLIQIQSLKLNNYNITL